MGINKYAPIFPSTVLPYELVKWVIETFVSFIHACLLVGMNAFEKVTGSSNEAFLDIQRIMAGYNVDNRLGKVLRRLESLVLLEHV